MDIKLPGMNGIEATRIIKEMRPQLPVIAQTAYASSEDQEKYQEAGFDGFLAKPIDRDMLFGMLETYLS
jgi:CheY-like chemotaxis protein